jgi:hypothetical protein
MGELKLTRNKGAIGRVKKDQEGCLYIFFVSFLLYFSTPDEPLLLEALCTIVSIKFV